METAGMKQIDQHCNMHKLLPSYQSAYTPYHSCETALLKIVNYILWNMENKKVTVLIAMDLSAAFDTVDHNILLLVLEREFGIKGTVLEWCKSYLKNRKFKVNVGKEYSEIKTFNYSVGQGNCNGPSYFGMYASSLKYHVENGLQMNAFADDHTLHSGFHPGPSEQQQLGKLKIT